jgi:hypothetical protein
MPPIAQSSGFPSGLGSPSGFAEQPAPFVHRRHAGASGVHEATRRADPPTTMRYDRARQALDRRSTCIFAAYIAGAAR